MGRNGLNEGLKGGWLQGSKTGFGHSRMESGFKKGILSEAGFHGKVQDPSILLGEKKPVVLWIADYSTNTGTTLNSISNLLDGESTLTIASSPAFVKNGFLGNRSYIDFNSAADRIYTTNNVISGESEMSVVMLVNMSSASNRKLLYKVDSTIASTAGDLTIDAIGGTKVRVTLIGSPTTTSSVYETYDPTIQGQWFLLTVKVRTYQPNGPGSEVEIFVNGSQNQTPVTTTYAPFNGFAADDIYFGNNSSATEGGSLIAGALVCPYWLNPAEQIRMENFFRWYYGRRF